jgi:hypothetical protein
VRLTVAVEAEKGQARVVTEADVSHPNWLKPGAVSAGQQAFGDALVKAHPFVLIQSVVSNHSWNVIFDSLAAKGLYDAVQQEPFVSTHDCIGRPERARIDFLWKRRFQIHVSFCFGYVGRIPAIDF